MLRKILDVFIFTSMYIALCAVIMVWQTISLLELSIPADYFWFVFFSTVCSYNFHWWLTPAELSPASRIRWLGFHRQLQYFLMIGGACAAALFFFRLWNHAGWILLATVLTFLYSAPKLPVAASNILKKIVIGKTLYLSFVWTYVTTVLPLLIDGKTWDTAALLFVCNRFFLIYAICIVFDFRDRESDKREGIRSMITWFNERGINFLYYVSLFLFAVSTLLLVATSLPFWIIAILFLPGLLLLFLYPYAKKNASDYLYFFVLDGLMMLSSLLLFLVYAVRPQ